MTRDWQRTGEELIAVLRDAQLQMNLQLCRSLQAIAELDVRGIAGDEGYGSTIELVRAAQNLTKVQARQRVAAALDLIPTVTPSGADVEPQLPHTARVLAAGLVNEAQVTVIQSAVAAVPPHADQHRAGLDQRLAKHAHELDSGQLRILGRRVLAYLDQDGTPPADEVVPARSLTIRQTRGGGARGEFVLDAEGAAALNAALSPLAAPRPATDGDPDHRTHDQRNADALVELATRALQQGDLPAESGERPQLLVKLDYDALSRTVRSAWLDGTGPIDPESARRIACDANVIPMVLGSRSEPLDVGRRSYTVPTPMRRALIERDGGCAHPGCAVPWQWCHAHHIKSWLDGGATALHNLVLLCPHHHRLIHHSKWRIEMIDNYPAFHPPPWLGDRPLHNPLHTTPG